jgi:uncharacterized protein involved in response to NO
MLNIQENPAQDKTPTFFRMAFRPFFLLAPIAALVLLMMWVSHYAGWFLTINYWHGFSGHSHEMVYGFAIAIVAGFLLTAARTWTGLETIKGWPLMMLVIVWLLGRILPWIEINRVVVAVVDLAFIPLVLLALAIPIIKVRQKRNFIFLPILILLWIGNLLMHLQQLGITNFGLHMGIYLGLDLIILLIVTLGGRVIPMFTGNGIGEKILTTPRLDLLAILSTIFFVIAHQINFQGPMLILASLIAFVVHIIRVSIWYHPKIWSKPLVWILHISYYWIVLGFGLMAGAALGYWSFFIALHALTIGGISGMILGMISRVSLGHTGRALEPPKLVVVAFVLIPVASLIRVFIPLFIPSLYTATVILSGIFWVVAMLLFVISYTKILLLPRIDGLP